MRRAGSKGLRRAQRCPGGWRGRSRRRWRIRVPRRAGSAGPAIRCEIRCGSRSSPCGPSASRCRPCSFGTADGPGVGGGQTFVKSSGEPVLADGEARVLAYPPGFENSNLEHDAGTQPALEAMKCEHYRGPLVAPAGPRELALGVKAATQETAAYGYGRAHRRLHRELAELDPNGRLTAGDAHDREGLHQRQSDWA